VDKVTAERGLHRHQPMSRGTYEAIEKAMDDVPV
jgi:hypothetical protein